MEKSVYGGAQISTIKNFEFLFEPSGAAEHVEQHCRTPTQLRETGWKSPEPNHTKLITSNKMVAVTKIGVCLS